MNQKKKRIFNVKLYIDGLKQLRMIGIMSFIILGLEAFLVPLGVNISNAVEKTVLETDGPTSTFVAGKVAIYGLLELHPFVLASFLIITPLMALFLFGFLNKRNSSDFYHSIPDSRESLYLSYAASIITWAIGIVVGTTLITVISVICMKNVSLNAATLWVTMFTTIAGCILVTGGFLMAMSLSGTVITNISVALMIIFLPRFLITVMTYSLSHMLSFAPFDYTENLLNDRYNVVTNLFSGLLVSGNVDGVNRVSSGIYTLIVGTILLAIGCVIFKKRNSEAATCAALNSKLQCAFRLIPAFVICMIPCTMIINYSVIVGIGTWSRSDRFEIIVLYVIAIVAYFLYELITTKKWKNVVKAVPGLLILLALNVIYIGILYGGIKVISNDTPSQNSIKAVRICDTNAQSYFTNKSEKINLTSEVARKLVSEQLEYTVDTWRNNRNRNGNAGYYVESYNQHTITLAIDKGMTTIYRNVTFTDDAYKKFIHEVYNNQEYREAFYDLPEVGKNQTTIDIYSNADIEDGEAEQLYKMYVNELQQLPFEEYYECVVNSDYTNAIGRIYVETTIGTKNYSLTLPISSELPNSMKAYIALASSDMDINPITDLLSKENETSSYNGNYSEYQISFTAYNGKERYDGSAYITNNSEQVNKDYTENGRKVLEAIAEKLDSSKQTYDTGKILLEINYSAYDQNQKDDYLDPTQNYSKWYVIDEETLGLINLYCGYSRK